MARLVSVDLLFLDLTFTDTVLNREPVQPLLFVKKEDKRVEIMPSMEHDFPRSEVDEYERQIFFNELDGISMRSLKSKKRMDIFFFFIAF